MIKKIIIFELDSFIVPFYQMLLINDDEDSDEGGDVYLSRETQSDIVRRNCGGCRKKMF